MFTYQQENRPEAVVVHLGGCVDCTQTNRLVELFQETREKADKDVIIELSDLTYIDSAGLGTLVAERSRWVRKGLQFRLCSPIPAVNSVFRSSHLDRLFEIHPTLEAALKA
jgi:anti-sigma B factor antagonist